MLLSSLVIVVSIAQLSAETIAQARAIAAITASEKAPPPRTVDVVHYALHLTLDPEARSISGRMELELKPCATPRRVITLDADELTIQAVTDAAGQALPFTARGATVEIDLGREVQPEESLRLAISYSATPARGLVFANGRDGHCQMVWSQGECQMSSAWFPCRDYPDDRASSELFVTLPDAWRSISNGVLIAATPASEGKRTDHWRMDFPHPAYLTSLVAGPLDEIDLGKLRDLPLYGYALPELQADAAATLQPTGAMIARLEQFSGMAYPYPVYRQSCVVGFPYGGMENIAATTLDQEALFAPSHAEEKRAEADALVVHELAHQWFGDLLTPASWADLWISEGFATFVEPLWLAETAGADEAAAAFGTMQTKLADHRAQDPRPIVSASCIELDDLFDPTVYEGGACFLRLLQQVIGPEKFGAAVQQLVARCQGRSITTAELEAKVQEVAGGNLANLWQEWLHSPGQMVIEFSWQFDEAAKRLELVAHQKQTGDGVPEVYHVPVAVAYQVGGARRTTTLQLDARRCRVAVECDTRPAFVRFNAGGALFGVITAVQAPAAWREQLTLDSDPLGRIEAARALATAWTGFADDGSENAADHAVERRLTLAALARAMVEDKVIPVRSAATTALGEIGGDVARTALGCALWDLDWRVRLAAAEALAHFKDDDLAAGLAIRRLQSERTYSVRAAALQAVAKIKGKEAVRPLQQLIADDGLAGELRGDALVAAASIVEVGPAQLAELVAAAIERSKAAVPAVERALAIEALGSLAPRSEAACDVLTALLEDPSPAIRAQVLEALDDETIPLQTLPALVAFYGRSGFPDQRALARERIVALVAKLPK